MAMIWYIILCITLINIVRLILMKHDQLIQKSKQQCKTKKYNCDKKCITALL